MSRRPRWMRWPLPRRNGAACKGSKSMSAPITCWKLAALAGLCLGLAPAALAAKKECRYPAPPTASINIVNQFGQVTVKPATGGQIVISATTASDQVEVDCNQVDGRVEATTHFLQRADSA